jgi:hypothetical protein
MTGFGAGKRDDLSREGRRIAQLFRQYRELGDVRACDLDAILAEDEIEVIPSREADPGYTACLMRAPAGCPGGGIFLAPGQDVGRRRFSLAHELGHFHIPSHAKTGADGIGYCADRDMRARSGDARRQEWEANDFAAELLMPRRLYAADVERLDVSVAAVQRLAAADMYDVSVTAAAWRLIQTTRERCAMVVSRDGAVEWIVRSDALRLPITERRQRLHPDTLAAGAFRGEPSESHPREVPAGAWLDEPTPVQGMLLESTHQVPALGQVISLIWLTDPDPEEGM